MLAAIRKRLGVKSLRDANRAQNYFYQYPFTFTSLATGNHAQTVQKITAAGAFVVTSITGVVWDTATLAMPAYAGAAPYGDLLPFYVSWSSNDGTFQSNPILWAATVGSAERPFFPIFKPVFAAGANVVVTFANSTGKTLSGQLVFNGYQVSGS